MTATPDLRTLYAPLTDRLGITLDLSIGSQFPMLVLTHTPGYVCDMDMAQDYVQLFCSSFEPFGLSLDVSASWQTDDTGKVYDLDMTAYLSAESDHLNVTAVDLTDLARHAKAYREWLYDCAVATVSLSLLTGLPYAPTPKDQN